MLKTIDIFIGLALVMLLISMIVTVITQVLTSLFNSRGKHLMQGVSDMLEQLHTGITREIAEEIAGKALRNPLVATARGRLGHVVHRDELTKLLLEVASEDGPRQLSAEAKKAMHAALVDNGICTEGTDEEIRKQIRDRLAGVRSLALKLELEHPEMTNAARTRTALIQNANSQFLAKINLWFDQTMDRASERFTAHTRYVTFFAGLAVALALQLDTASLVSRLSTDNDLRTSLLSIAEKQNAAPAAGDANVPVHLTDTDRQNLKDLVVNNVIGIPQSTSDWLARWNRDNCLTKGLGIILTALLLSLGAPFWYGTLQNLIRLRSVLATKDDQQRDARQTPGQPPPAMVLQDGPPPPGVPGDLVAAS